MLEFPDKDFKVAVKNASKSMTNYLEANFKNSRISAKNQMKLIRIKLEMKLKRTKGKF